MARYKALTEDAINRARTAEQRAKDNAMKQLKKAQAMQAEAEALVNQAKRSESHAREQLEKMTHHVKSEVSKAQKYVSNTEKSKNHAAGAMERHKRKIEQLRTDKNALQRFVQKYHPELIG